MVYHWTRPEIYKFSPPKTLTLNPEGSRNGENRFIGHHNIYLSKKTIKQIVFVPYFTDEKTKSNWGMIYARIPKESQEQS